jgi:predicted esterase
MAASERADLGFVHRFEPGSSPWTLLLLHGTGSNEHDLIGLGRELAPEAALLSPRGKVLEGGVSPRFFARHGVGNLDLDDLRFRAGELADFVLAAAEAYGRDPSRIVALGYSNGANIAVGLLYRRPGLLRGAVLLRAMLPYVPDPLPDLAGTDVLVAAGRRDPYSPPESTAGLVEVLEGAGAAVRANVAPAGHELTQEDLAVAAEFIRGLAAG